MTAAHAAEDPSAIESVKACQRFFNELEEEPLLFFGLQILWLQHKYPKRLGRELGGLYGDQPEASVREAAMLLYLIAKYEYKQVQPLGQGHLPLIEGLIRFRNVTYSFLPDTQPAVFVPGSEIVTFSQLTRNGRAPDYAVNHLLRRLRRVVHG
jgi:hypothetical protein